MYDELIEERTKRAEAYHQRTRSQQEWYSGKAGTNKKMFQTLGLSIVVLGAVVGILPAVLGQFLPDVTNIAVSLLGALIVILKGFERIWLPEEKWMIYRKAAEALQREHEKYTECIEPYYVGQLEQDNTQYEDHIYQLFVQRCILIKAEEQNNFWGLNEEKNNQEDKIAQSE